MEPASPNIPGLKENKSTDNVRCPLGCKTVGYDSITRYHEHLRKTHHFTKQFMKLITHLVRKNGHLSLGEKWKITYPTVVSQQTTIPQDAAIPQETIAPPPYIYSPDEYKSASRNPPQAILERMKGHIRGGTTSAPTLWWPSMTNEEKDRYLRDEWLPLIPSFLDSVDEEGLYGDAKPTDNVRCPLGCKTVGYDSTTRYHEHLHKTHHFTKQFMKLITHLVRRNGHLSLGEKWKITYAMVVSQQMAIPQEMTVPPPYIHSPDEYKSASRNPPQAILERMKGHIRDGTTSAPTLWWPSMTNEEKDRYLRDVLQSLIPSFLDSVDEEGLYRSRPCIVPTEPYANIFEEGVWGLPN